MNTMIILVGFPATGKTTWRQKNRNNIDYVYSIDDEIEKMASDQGVAYNQIFNDAVNTVTQSCQNDLHKAMQSGVDVTIDRTNLTAKSRKKYVELAKEYGYNVIALVFDPPAPSEWEKRLLSRPGKDIPPDVLVKMIKDYEEPSKKEGFAVICV